MKFKTFLMGLFCAVTSVLRLFAQAPLAPACNPAQNGKLICVLPQTYGPSGLVLPNPAHQAHFVSSFQENFRPLTVSVGTELTLLSLASPASGVSFTFDRSLGVVTRSTESYGPILSERAETIGRHRVYIAGTYQMFHFSSLDGIDLNHVPVVFGHAEFQVPNPSGGGTVFPPYESEYITTENRIDLKVHQVTLYGTYGLTDRIDVSVAVPIMDVRFGITSAANIVRTVPQPVLPGQPFYSSTDNTGFFHFFNLGNPAGSTSATFHNAGNATGIGDVVFRAKGTVIKGEHVRVALGLDVRTPTGDAANFLGAGAPGVKPFVAASYRARLSPHVNLGFEWNGDSILAGDIASGSSGKLPNEFFYSAGVDFAVSKRATVAADLLGQRLSSDQRLTRSTFTDVNGGTAPTIALSTGPVNMDDISLGVKISPFGNLLVTGNVLFKANDAGLRATVIPLVGISYTF